MLEIDAAEARLRSERRLGELMAEMPKAKGKKGRFTGGVKSTPPVDDEPTLSDCCIDKNLAKAARTAAAVPKEEFQEILETHREQPQNTA